MRTFKRIVNFIVRLVFHSVCRINNADFRQFPARGPMILVGNHVNFLEAPIMFSQLDSPYYSAIAKRESWKNPLFNFLFNLWGIIPIDRGVVDREAFRLAYAALAKDKILIMAPEGTRSKDGCLLPGKPGVTALALRGDTPLFPAVMYGHENFWQNLKRLRRTQVNVSVGKPFRIDPQQASLARESRQAVTDEVMYKLAELLPERYRGAYQFEGKITYRYLIDVD